MKSEKSAKKSDEKSKNNQNEEQPEDVEPKKENPKNLERFIYITSYTDRQFIETLKTVFEEINQAALELRSPKEIYTQDLTEEQRDDNTIDYISGFQIIDKVMRITIIEGITGKAMKKLKEALPKKNMNSANLKILSDSNILFDKRIYSKFDLSLKMIKLRDNLTQILSTFDLYLKAENYKQIYDAFLNLGSILKSETLSEVAICDLFPDAESLLLMERKYGDIISKEDMTGIPKPKKKRKSALWKTNAKNTLNNSYNKSLNNESNNNSYNLGSSSDKEQSNDVSINNEKPNNDLNEKNDKNEKNGNNQRYNTINSVLMTPETNNIKDLITKGDNVDTKNLPKLNSLSVDRRFQNTNRLPLKTENFYNNMLKLRPKTLAKNDEFENILKEREENKLTTEETIKKNIDYIKRIKRKPGLGRFWRNFVGDYDKSKEIYFNSVRKNHFEEVVDQMRQKFIKDKDHLYTYGNNHLTLNFPMIDRERNENYINYIENKKKWVVKNDFDRYKQPARDKFYFPKINKEI